MTRTRYRYLISTQARVKICPRCRSVILVGVSEGLTTRVDPLIAGRQDQAFAIITRRGVYTLINRTLVARVDPYGHWPVLIEHRCGQPIGQPPEPKSSTGDRPPF
jgi:hypothetical protein